MFDSLIFGERVLAPPQESALECFKVLVRFGSGLLILYYYDAGRDG